MALKKHHVSETEISSIKDLITSADFGGIQALGEERCL